MKWFRYHLLAAALVLTFAALALQSFSMVFRNNLLHSEQQHLQAELTATLAAIEQHLHERLLDAKVLPLTMAELFQQQSSEVMTQRLDQLVLLKGEYSKILLLGADGSLVAQNSIDPFGRPVYAMSIEADYLAGLDWFEQMSMGKRLEPGNRSGTLVVGPEQFLLNEDPLRFDMLFASQIQASGGELLGYWVGVMDFARIEAILTDTLRGMSARGLGDSRLLLLDSKNKLLAEFAQDNNRHWQLNRDYTKLNRTWETRSQSDKSADVMSMGAAWLSLNEPADALQVVASPINLFNELNTGWSLALEVPETALLSRFGSFNQPGFIVLALLCLSLVAWLAFLYQTVLLPLTRIEASLPSLARLLNHNDKLNTDALPPLLRITAWLARAIDALETQSGQWQEFQRELQLLRAVSHSLDALPRAVLLMSVEDHGRILYASKWLEVLTGYSPHELKGKPLMQLLEDGSNSRIEKLLSSGISYGRSCNGIVKQLRKDGHGFYSQLSAFPVWDQNGEVSHYVVALDDIHEETDKHEPLPSYETHTLSPYIHGDLFLLLDREGEILDASDALALLLGYEHSLLLQQDFAELSPYWDLSSNFPEQLSLLNHEGRVLDFSLSGQFSNLDGRELCWLWLSTGRVEDSASDSPVRETGYRAAFLQAPVGFARIGIDGTWLEVNDKFCGILGCSREQITLMDSSLAINLEQFEDCLRFSDLMLTNELKFHTDEKRFLRLDDNIVWLNVSVCLIRDKNGQPRYFLMACEDISQRKQFELVLTEAKFQREELIKGRDLASEAGGIGNWSMDIETGELHWDSRMYQTYGLDNDGRALTYEDWSNQVHPEDIEEAELRVRTAIEERRAYHAEFRVINRKTGNIHWIKAAGDTITRNGVAVKLFGINLDVTDVKLVQQTLERESAEANQASQAKSRFLAVMSHEIRTPMNGVVGMIDLLRDTGLSSEQQRMANTIRDSAFSLLEIINDILDFSKIEAGKMELEIEPTSLLSILEKTVEVLWFNAASKNVFLNILPDLSLPREVLLDPVRIRQIVLNLLGNAIKFSHNQHQQGLVMLRTEFRRNHTQEHEVVLEVIDNGVGMTREQMNQLFEPFTQADSSTTRKYGGTGLGLTITKSFIDLMGGKIEVESEPNVGSTFRIRLPCRTADPYGESEQELYQGLNPGLIICIENKQYLVSVLHLLDQLELEYRCINPRNISGNLFDANLLDDFSGLLISDYYQAYKAHKAEHPRTHLPYKLLMMDEDSISSKGEESEGVCVLSCHPLKPSDLLAGMAMLNGQPNSLWTPFAGTERGKMGRSASETDIAKDSEFRILVAEDHETNREVISLQLKKIGCRFELAEDGAKALELWKTGRFRVLLTDCHMPNMDGFELTAEVRRLEKEQQLEPTLIIAITANAMSGEAENCLAAGMDDYLAKPVEFKLLKSKLLAWHGRNSLKQRQQQVVTAQETVGEDSPIDYRKLAEILGTDDEEVLNSIVQYFLDALARDIEPLYQAMDEGEAEEIRRLAHALKGAANSSGASRLGQIFSELEQQAAAKDLHLVHEFKTRIEEQVSLLAAKAQPQGDTLQE
ncbi:PAS domain S-box protein [Shewanella cyperi]|uniref:Sensory/regulatory protein RpfC n=1 Tax=Shewanella cyperi TaxID=2814292 RepID=A0A974XHI8_9GAMM|nr:PAS domain S-box protein [Shewanella cyperi]QSX28520.1 PAS domain S-box protein [Shewanella cyperi]